MKVKDLYSLFEDAAVNVGYTFYEGTDFVVKDRERGGLAYPNLVAFISSLNQNELITLNVGQANFDLVSYSGSYVMKLSLPSLTINTDPDDLCC